MATKNVLIDLNLNQNELQNAVIQNLATAPSSPKAGQQYFNTTSKQLFVYDGTQWIDCTNIGAVYTEGNGIDISASNVVSVDLDVVQEKLTEAQQLAVDSTITATKVSAYETHIADDDIHVTTDDKEEWSGKQDALNTAQLNAVNSGIDSTKVAQIATNAGDISDIQDTLDGYGDIVSHNASEFYLATNPDGFLDATEVGSLISTHNSATTAHSDIRGLISDLDDSKLDKNEAITGATKCKITYDANGLVTGGADLVASDIPDISATYIAVSTKGQANGVAELDANGLVPASQLPSYVDDVIDAYIVGETPLASGWLSKTAGGSALTPETGKIYVILSAGEYANKTYRWSGSTYVEISSSPAQATESLAGIAKLATEAQAKALTDDATIVTPLKLGAVLVQEASATRTLENKTIDADDNAISNLELDNFKSGVVQTSVRATSSASDTAIVSEKAVASALALKTGKLTATNPALTPVGGVATWTISNTLANADVVVMIKEVATGDEIIAEVVVSSSNVVIKMNAGATIAEGLYKAVIIG